MLIGMVLRSLCSKITSLDQAPICPLSTHLPEPPAWIPGLGFLTLSLVTPMLPLPYSGTTRMPIFSLIYPLPCFQDPVFYSFPYLTSSELGTDFCMARTEVNHTSTSVCCICPWETPSLLSTPQILPLPSDPGRGFP